MRENNMTLRDWNVEVYVEMFRSIESDLKWIKKVFKHPSINEHVLDEKSKLFV